MCKNIPEWYVVGQVVYIRAVVTDIGKCGLPAVSINTPNGQAMIIPDSSVIFKRKAESEVVLTRS